MLLKDDFMFTGIPADQFKTIVFSHVLEHFTDAASVIRKIFKSVEIIGIERVIIVVPGVAGYASDKTHRTFIDIDYLKNNDLLNSSGYKLTRYSYFPFPASVFGRFFFYQELKLIYDKK